MTILYLCSSFSLEYSTSVLLVLDWNKWAIKQKDCELKDYSKAKTIINYSACGVMVIVAGYGYGNTSSNPGLD